MLTTHFENAVRFESDVENLKVTLIRWLDDILKGNVSPDDLRDQMGVLLDRLVQLPEHVCECDHDEDKYDEMEEQLRTLRDELSVVDDLRDEVEGLRDQLTLLRKRLNDIVGLATIEEAA